MQARWHFNHHLFNLDTVVFRSQTCFYCASICKLVLAAPLNEDNSHYELNQTEIQSHKLTECIKIPASAETYACLTCLAVPLCDHVCVLELL